MNIIITGASRGIGFELTRQFCSMKGNHIIALAREIRTIQLLSEKLPVEKNESILYPLTADLNKKGFEKPILEYVLDRFETIDILINNAGALINKPFHQLTSDDFDYLFKVNTKAPFLIIQTLLPLFNNPSHIINISSMGGLQGSTKFPGLSLYSASKGALAILTECLVSCQLNNVC
ncbi:MAG: SDR family NAD(P)-dependent oxidoreductase [Bacteroidota bacterium]